MLQQAWDNQVPIEVPQPMEHNNEVVLLLFLHIAAGMGIP